MRNMRVSKKPRRMLLAIGLTAVYAFFGILSLKMLRGR